MTSTKHKPGTRKQAETKFIDDPVRFIMDSGLGWYLNRFVFHPLGLILMGKENEKTRKMDLVIVDRREWCDTAFSESENRTGYRKHQLFMKREGGNLYRKSQQIKGYQLQPLPDTTNG